MAIHGLIVLQAQRDEVEIRGRKKHRCCQGNPRHRMKPCYAVSTEALLQQHRNLSGLPSGNLT